jgi:hypothetical protein
MAELSRKKGTQMKSTSNGKKSRPVVVTTAHRGVFFGYADDTDGETIALKKARLCVYWSQELRGFMGLASSGPNKNCKIGPAADITLRNITSVLECSSDAEKAWNEGPWK